MSLCVFLLLSIHVYCMHIVLVEFHVFVGQVYLAYPGVSVVLRYYNWQGHDADR